MTTNTKYVRDCIEDYLIKDLANIAYDYLTSTNRDIHVEPTRDVEPRCIGIYSLCCDYPCLTDPYYPTASSIFGYSYCCTSKGGCGLVRVSTIYRGKRRKKKSKRRKSRGKKNRIGWRSEKRSVSRRMRNRSKKSRRRSRKKKSMRSRRMRRSRQRSKNRKREKEEISRCSRRNKWNCGCTTCLHNMKMITSFTYGGIHYANVRPVIKSVEEFMYFINRLEKVQVKCYCHGCESNREVGREDVEEKNI